MERNGYTNIHVQVSYVRRITNLNHPHMIEEVHCEVNKLCSVSIFAVAGNVFTAIIML